MYNLKPVTCGNCKYFNRDSVYLEEGKCSKDGRYSREHRCCDLLPTNKDKREAKINIYR